MQSGLFNFLVNTFQLIYKVFPCSQICLIDFYISLLHLSSIKPLKITKSNVLKCRLNYIHRKVTVLINDSQIPRFPTVYIMQYGY